MASRGEWAAWKIALWIIAIMVVLYAGVMDRGWLMGQVAQERGANHKVLGEHASSFAEQRADRWFRALFVDTGAVQGSYRMLDARSNDSASGVAEKANKTAAVALDWVAERVQVLWVMLYQMFNRASVALMWWPYAFLIGVPFVVDALVVRKIKASNFGLTSPHAYALGRRTAKLVPWVFLILLLAPFSLSGVYVPVMLAALAMATWVGMVQFAKRG